MAALNKAQKAAQQMLEEAKDLLADAQQKFDAVMAKEDTTDDERAAVKAELEGAKKMVEEIEATLAPQPAKPNSQDREFHTISCVYANGQYPKLGIKFRNHIAVVNNDQLAAAKASRLWNRDIFAGVKPSPKTAVKVVKE